MVAVLCQISRVLEAARRRAITTAAAIAIAVTSGCSGPSPAACPNDYPSACPTPAPSFTTDVLPLIQTNCTPCHGPGQQVPTLNDYASVMAAATRVSMQVFQCRMPPAPRAPLTSEERQTLFSWLVCGVRDN
jgi:hypothetical protein